MKPPVAALALVLVLFQPAVASAEVDINDRVRALNLGLHIGDALAMPVHWYYDKEQLRRDFGAIEKYEAPKSSFAGSIMNLSNTGGAGRGSDSGTIIGDVINHGKKKYWLRSGQYHYHHGLPAGANTLESLITRLVGRELVKTDGRVDSKAVREAYVDFMTTPGSHNDVYAHTYHRMFFANREAGASLEDCPGNDNHNVDSIDGLVYAPLIALANWRRSAEERAEQLALGTALFRKSTMLPRYATVIGELFLSVLRGADLRAEAQRAAVALGFDVSSAPSQRDPTTS